MLQAMMPLLHLYQGYCLFGIQRARFRRRQGGAVPGGARVIRAGNKGLEAGSGYVEDEGAVKQCK